MAHLAPYIIPSLLGFLLPLTAIVVGTIAMRGSGMLPAQARLDDILKSTIDAMQDRIESLEKELAESRAENATTEKRVADMDAAHRDSMLEKEKSIAALQRALVAEQHGSDQLRVQVGIAERKIAALTAQYKSTKS